MEFTVLYVLFGWILLNAFALIWSIRRDARRSKDEFDGGFSAQNDVRVTRIMSDHVITIHGDEK